MGSKLTTDINVQRVWELYQVKGMTAKLIAAQMDTTIEDVRAALTINAREQRETAQKAATAMRIINQERLLFDRAFPQLKGDEGLPWRAWLARSKFKTDASRR